MPAPSARLLAHYKQLRDYIVHEDNLISNRISSTLLAHGFLIASYALLLQSRIGATAQCQGRDMGCISRAAAAVVSPEKFAKPSREAVEALTIPDQLIGLLSLADLILPVIALIGVFTTMAALGAVKGAERAIDSIRDRWKHISRELYADQDVLPPMTSGWDAHVDTRFGGISKGLLWILLCMWWIIVAITAIELFLWYRSDISAWISYAWTAFAPK